MKKKKVLLIIALAALSAVLIGTGLFRVVRVYSHYRTDMLSYESRHLDSIVSTAARGMDWMLDGYVGQVGQMMNRREFVQAEEEYLDSGDGAVMTALMARREVLPPNASYVAVYDGTGEFLAATSERYPRGNGADEALSDNIALRTDGDGRFWFVFDQTSSGGLRYELAVRVQELFSYQAYSAHVGRQGYFFLLDREGTLFCYSSEAKSAIQDFETFMAEHPDVDGSALEKIAEAGDTGAGEYAVFRYPWGTVLEQTRADNETLVTVSPLTNGGGRLILGAAESFGEFDSFLSDTLWEVALIILTEITGMLLLVILAAWALVTNRRAALELQVVRQRANLMEEINRQQQSLAHTERLQQLGVMTGGIIHEVNNMLTPIMGQSYLLLEELADQEASPAFDSALDIYEASEKARDVLKRMSAMSKKDVDMGFAALDLCALLQKTMNLSSMAKDTHIHQELALTEQALFVFGNDQLLTQAFLNLMINGCQAMGSEGTLTVTVQKETRSGHGYARVEVSDTGPGIPADRLNSIYDPFFTTKGESGTGLGLAICQKIIETHKGTIVAANRQTGGAVFTVRIPLCPPPGEDG